MSTIEQSRHLATSIPGPLSKELIARKTAAVSRGIGNTMPVYTARAGGGIIEDVDGNRLIDVGSGIAVTTIGNASPRVVDAVRRARFAEHPRAEVSLAAQVRPNQLQCDDAVDEDVTRAIDDAHAAFARPGLEPVSTGDDASEHRILRLRCTTRGVHQGSLRCLSRLVGPTSLDVTRRS